MIDLAIGVFIGIIIGHWAPGFYTQAETWIKSKL